MYTCLQEKFRMTHSKRKKNLYLLAISAILAHAFSTCWMGNLYIYEVFDISLMFSLNKDNE